MSAGTPHDPSMEFITSLCDTFISHNRIDPSFYERWDVKRGLRNADGTGVMAGLTQIGNVLGYYVQDGERNPMEGRLFYRGIDVSQLAEGFLSEGRFGFEETVYLLLLGSLPTAAQLSLFQDALRAHQALPPMFTEDVILRSPSSDVMNQLQRSILALYSYDENPEDLSPRWGLHQALGLIARTPLIVAHAFWAKRHYYDGESLTLHFPQKGLSLAENFLYMLRQDNQYTPEEARLLDLCLVLHAEHGGGNNSAFACRVLSSSLTDIYSSIAAAVGALKGGRHGGANRKVREMFTSLAHEVRDWEDDDAVSAYLEKLVRGEAGDRSGLIYGMGHAIYTLSDPRAVLLKRFAEDLARQKGMLPQFRLIGRVERLAPQVLSRLKGREVVLCANIDLYSGFVYRMLSIPPELYTPLFAIARMAGWCAHRLEEVCNPGNKIIRPAYKAVAPLRPFVPLAERG